MGTNWYVAKNKTRLGPYNLDALRFLVSSGTLLPSDMVLPEGTKKWLEAGTILDLFPLEGKAGDSLSKDARLDSTNASNSANRAGSSTSMDDGQVTKTIPRIAEPVSPPAREWVPLVHEPSNKNSAQGVLGAALGILLLVGGMVGLLKYWAMSTTVWVPETNFLGERIGGSPVHNIGLLHEKQNGLILSAAAAVCGLILCVFSRRT